MADNQGNLTDDTSDEISNNYRSMNHPNEEDDNDEGIVEYLDLDLENESIHDIQEYSFSEAPTTSNESPSQLSVLKKAVVAKTKRTSKPKSARAKSTRIIPERSIMRTRSSTEDNANSTNRTTKRKDSCSSESATLHAAINVINAQLAVSGNSVNGHAANDKRIGVDTLVESKFRGQGSTSKPSLDGLDLFFQSMAQTVMSLPATIQAKIKMDICKVITMAEMKYASEDTSQELNKH